jgi:hypothetical protein
MSYFVRVVYGVGWVSGSVLWSVRRRLGFCGSAGEGLQRVGLERGWRIRGALVRAEWAAERSD